MRDLALSMRNLRSGDVTFMTLPSSGTGMEESQSVVYVDEEKSAELWKAVRDDAMPAYFAEHGNEDALGDEVH